MSEWKPRGRDVVIGGVPWLARMADKAQAKADGTIGEYIYPCPMDQRLLGEAGISPEQFTELVTGSASDDDLAKAFKQKSGRDDWTDYKV